MDGCIASVCPSNAAAIAAADYMCHADVCVCNVCPPFLVCVCVSSVRACGQAHLAGLLSRRRVVSQAYLALFSVARVADEMTREEA
jgi:hypothetical protein